LPRGRKRKLTEAEERCVDTRLDSNPDATNTELATTVQHKVAPRTVNDILTRSQPEATEAWTDQVMAFIQGMLRHLPLRHRVYADESGILLNEVRNYGRARRGSRALRVRQHHAQKLTLYVCVKEHEAVRWEPSVLNATDAEILGSSAR